MQPVIIGIAGGTGSGKTTLTKKIISRFGKDCVSVIDVDSYYRDRSHLPLQERHHLNFDHPDALDIQLLARHLKSLKQGKPIRKHVYDFATHTRKQKAVEVLPKKLVVVDGILIFALDKLGELFDLKIFIDEDADIRLLRRIGRDVRERGRTLDAVIKQYLETVRPMHLQYVEPSRNKADIILKPGGNAKRVLDSIKKLLVP